MEPNAEVRVRATQSRREANRWILVLEAKSIPHRLAQAEEAYELYVPTARWSDAEAELTAEDSEHDETQLDEPTDGPAFHVVGAAAVSSLLIAFQAFVFRYSAWGWFDHGAASAEDILDGGVWRAVTALTLHRDTDHLWGNALAALVFLGAVAARLGPGFGALCVLLAGALGNGANALYQQRWHHSIGASTAVFGALGILAGLRITGRIKPTRSRRVFLVAGAALGLFAMLGVGGANTDVAAHAFGVLAGLLVGVLASIVRGPLGPASQFWSAVLALALVALSWWAAFTA